MYLVDDIFYSVLNFEDILRFISDYNYILGCVFIIYLLFYSKTVFSVEPPVEPVRPVN